MFSGETHQKTEFKLFSSNAMRMISLIAAEETANAAEAEPGQTTETEPQTEKETERSELRSEYLVTFLLTDMDFIRAADRINTGQPAELLQIYADRRLDEITDPDAVEDLWNHAVSVQIYPAYSVLPS